MFTGEFLSGVRRQALRRRVWYSALDGLERGILSISARIIDDVKSSLLNVQLVRIIAKLRDACKSGFVRHLERYGVERVRVVQGEAFRLGYLGAGVLSKDLGFIRYLMFLDYNQPIGWRIYPTH
ncbi:MAG: hypothetical protein ABSA11_09090 [Candidatus Bathyarchaeia archaeon]